MLRPRKRASAAGPLNKTMARRSRPRVARIAERHLRWEEGLRLRGVPPRGVTQQDRLDPQLEAARHNGVPGFVVANRFNLVSLVHPLSPWSLKGQRPGLLLGEARKPGE